MPLTRAVDHRAIDDATAVGFFADLMTLIEDLLCIVWSENPPLTAETLHGSRRENMPTRGGPAQGRRFAQASRAPGSRGAVGSDFIKDISKN
jgi:hypothetical protein